ncbi:hypothetical protein BC937DRAFT_95378 [Endogone sp. FLAS-F59071]|nr:hypothetical protein BC937DRAFT_95378 [Endogone sp. FLAS-F59071]|eukprot:RUS13407.1 hypothetical protein BC937DRAFT_95378 [Endogone sp. FLAS-F59071]
MRAVVSAVGAIWLGLFFFLCQNVLTLLDWLSARLMLDESTDDSSSPVVEHYKKSSKSSSTLRGESKKKPPVLYATTALPSTTTTLKRNSKLSAPPSPILRHDIQGFKARQSPLTSSPSDALPEKKDPNVSHTRSRKRGQHSPRAASYSISSDDVSSILAQSLSPATAQSKHLQLSARPTATRQKPRVSHRKTWSDLSRVSFPSVSFSSVPLKRISLHRTVVTIRDLPAEVMMLIFEFLPLLPEASNNDLLNCLLVCRNWEMWAAPTLWRSPIIYSRTGVQGRKSSISLPWTNPASAMWPASRLSRNWSPAYLMAQQPSNQYMYRTSDLRPNGLPVNFHLPAKYARLVHNLDLSTGVAYVTDLTVREVAFSCPNLRRLNISGCTNVTDRGMAFLARSACARRLTSLNLERCVGITDVGLRELGKTCTELENLNLSGCTEIADAGITAIAKGCTRRRRERLGGKWAGGRLRRIRLTDCKLVTEAGIKELVERCGESLLVLDLARIGRITDEVAQLMTVKCKKLEWLNLARPSQLQTMLNTAAIIVPSSTPTSPVAFPDINSQDVFSSKTVAPAEYHQELSDATVELLTSNFTSLRLLDLSYQIRITNQAVDSISRNCLSLVCLTIVGCRGITADSLRYLARLRSRSGRLGCITMGDAAGITEEEVDGITNDPEGMLNGWQKSNAAASDEGGFMRELLELSGATGWDDMSFGFDGLVGAA